MLPGSQSEAHKSHFSQGAHMSSDETNPFQSPQTLDSAWLWWGAVQGRTVVYPFASGHTRAVFAMTFLALVMVVHLLSAGSSYMQIGNLESFRAGVVFTPREIHFQIVRLAILGYGGTILYWASAISFLMWLHRSQRNLPALGNRQPEFSPAWAVGGWFIPVYNLVHPYLVASALWKGSDPENHNLFLAKGGRTPALVRFWWGLFLAMNFTYSVASFIVRFNSAPKVSVDGLITGSWVFIAGCLLSLPAGLAAILLVRGIDRNQERRHELVEQRAAAAPSTAPAPVAVLPDGDFPFVPPASEETWTPPEDEGEYPRFN